MEQIFRHSIFFTVMIANTTDCRTCGNKTVRQILNIQAAIGFTRTVSLPPCWYVKQKMETNRNKVVHLKTGAFGVSHITDSYQQYMKKTHSRSQHIFVISQLSL